MFHLPRLIFSMNENSIFLEDCNREQRLFCLPAHNNTVNPHGDPMVTGSNAPAPFGFLCLSLPDFISHDYRREFYRRFIFGPGPGLGESLVEGWGEFLVHEMGPVRFALGSPHAPEGTADRAAWDRELLIHGGGYPQKLTHGCIRMADHHIEQLAAMVIVLMRRGVPVTSILKVP